MRLKIMTSIVAMTTLSFGASAQNVNIPDANFKTYLVSNTTINTNSDAEIQVSEASTFTGSILCYWASISDLTGIEAFTNLTELRCNNNLLTTFDLTLNTALTVLDCGNNEITALDVTLNSALTDLNCRNNQLTSLDVTQNTALTNLNCFVNQILALDLTQNTALINLECGHNRLTTLDLTLNTGLTGL